jgi:coproporphyrinogen III oxidase-like Fe-S oxidoreductase
MLEGTRMEKGLPLVPSQSAEAEMTAFVRERLFAAGYEQWSSADFCKPGGMTLYNIDYWRAPQTLVLGLGAGAHTHLFGSHVWANAYSVRKYMSMVSRHEFPAVLGQRVTPDDLMRRYFSLGAHCLSLDLRPFRSLYGVDAEVVFATEIADLESRGWITVADSTLKVTEYGQLYISNIKRTFFAKDQVGEAQPWGKRLAHASARAHQVPLQEEDEL